MVTTAAAQVWVTAPAAWAGWQRRVGELDVVERARLASLRPPDTARAYAVLHLLARDVLAGVVGGSPAGIVMTRSCPRCGAEHGPPRLVGHPALHVSLSRTTGLVVVAVTTDAPVGVDVESVAATGFAGFDAVATHPSERGPGRDDHDRARSWVRKECALKALGVGLRADPTTVREPSPGRARTVLPGHPPVLVLDVPLDAVPGTQGYVAALALAAPRADHDPTRAVEPVPDIDVLDDTTTVDTIDTINVVVHAGAGACRRPR
ncbi:MAG: 4'-phosphopantetheinyl transferase superfamily protein [Humibacillus sp.]